jgi:toxin-antitoxin system PIN domain toxin
VKLPDANVLLYAVHTRSPHHERMRGWLEVALSGTETVGFAWVALIAFVRIATNPRVFTSPLAPTEAFEYVDEWLKRPVATVVHPGPRHGALLRELLEPIGTAGNLTTDAHLAALAIEHAGTLYSADTDFARFARLRWTNPLLA